MQKNPSMKSFKVKKFMSFVCGINNIILSLYYTWTMDWTGQCTYPIMILKCPPDVCVVYFHVNCQFSVNSK